MMNPASGMLEFDATPEYETPMRYFLTAPLFGISAGCVLLLSPEVLSSRWMPGAFAVTHLVALGFMFMVMVGALFQILPVVAGAPVAGGAVVGKAVHAGLIVGTVILAVGLALTNPPALVIAGWVLGATFAIFLSAVAVGLRGGALALDSQRDLRIALSAFAVAAMLGATLAMALALGWSVPLIALLELHVGWALLGGAGILLAATGWIVVPMFQITPAYPRAMVRYWAAAVVALLVSWSLAVLVMPGALATTAAFALIMIASGFPVVTLMLQRRSRRQWPDATQRAFRLAMVCLVAGSGCVLLAMHLDGDALPMLAGTLIIYGGFCGAVQGMLYKIVPFLTWLHMGRTMKRPPNMKQLQPDRRVRRQEIVHMVALALVLVAIVVGHPALVRFAGVLVVLDFALLFGNMLTVVRVHHRHERDIRGITPSDPAPAGLRAE